MLSRKLSALAALCLLVAGCTATSDPATPHDGGLGVEAGQWSAFTAAAAASAAVTLDRYAANASMGVGEVFGSAQMVAADIEGDAWVWTLTQPAGDGHNGCVRVYAKTLTYTLTYRPCPGDGAAAWPDTRNRSLHDGYATLNIGAGWVRDGHRLPSPMTVGSPLPGFGDTTVTGVLENNDTAAATVVNVRADTPSGCLLVANAKPGQSSGTVWLAPDIACARVPSLDTRTHRAT